jgi:hypothetical protein
MPCSRATQRAISGSRLLPCSVNALPWNPLPSSLSWSTAFNAASLEKRAASVAVTPRLRARTQATRSAA